jgi:hypothetical protein
MQKRGRRPPWFKLKKQSRVEKGDELLPERAAAVLWMFMASASGMGAYDVAAKIPKRFRQSWSSGEWTDRAVAKILTNRDARGVIVDRDMFDGVQKKRASRARGRKANYENVFASVSRCECCEQSMKLRADVLVCENPKCPARRVGWPYRGFEDSFDSVTEVIDKRTIARAQTQADVKVVEYELTLWRERQAAIQRQIDALTRDMAEIQDQHIAPLEVEKLRLQNQEDDVLPDDKQSGVVAIRDENESYRVRAAIASRIREEIRDVLIAPNGTTPRFDERIKQLKRWKIEPETFKQDFVDGMTDLKERPFFIVRFNDCAELLAVPSKRNPRRVYYQWSSGPPLGKAESARQPNEQIPSPRVVAVITPPANVTEFSFSIQT